MELNLNLTDFMGMRQLRPKDLRRVLVVEDDVLLREMIVDALAVAGFQTCEACCAGEALELLRDPRIADEIAAMVTDVDMPGDLDGIGLAARVNENWPRIGVVITSGAHRGGALLQRRPNLFLPKPFRTDRLVAAIRSLIEPEFASAQRCAS